MEQRHRTMSTHSWLNTWIPDGTHLRLIRSHDESTCEGRVVDCRIYKGEQAAGVSPNHIYYMVHLDTDVTVYFTLNKHTGAHVSGDMVV